MRCDGMIPPSTRPRGDTANRRVAAPNVIVAESAPIQATAANTGGFPGLNTGMLAVGVPSTRARTSNCSMKLGDGLIYGSAPEADATTWLAPPDSILALSAEKLVTCLRVVVSPAPGETAVSRRVTR